MRYIFILLSFIVSTYSFAQESVSNRIIVIGNAHEAISQNRQFLNAIKNSIELDENTIIVYLGNYTTPQLDSNVLLAEANIISGTSAKAFFVPGYNEWNYGREWGFKSVRAQQELLTRLNNDKIKIYPGDGCPGPKNVDLKNGAEIFIMDSQWWLHEHSKPDIESDCKYRTKEEVLSEMEDIVKDHYDKLILFLSYHPFESDGVHSGTFGIKQHIFPLTDIRPLRNFYLPLPILGSVYPIARNAITTKQDMNNPAYYEMRESGIGSLTGIRRAFLDHAHTIFISGQEHNLQLLKDGQQYFLNSGTGSGGGRIRQTRSTEYASNKAGFAVIEITEDKKAHSYFYEVQGASARQKHYKELFDYSSLPALANDTTTLAPISADSFTSKANVQLAKSTALKRLFVGENYRKEWGANVKMKVFHPETEKGGLKITGIGGGHESKSLQLEDEDGNEWVLRSSSKNLNPVTPEGFQETIASDLFHDLLSACHPYGSLVVPDILTALNIPHASPEFVFISNDSSLREFKPLFANTVGQLEERRPAINDNKTHNTHTALNRMVEESDHLSDQKTFLKARYVDFLLSDFDRHDGQWKWGTIDSAGREMYYPIPKDRDQALYNNKGLIMKIGRKKGYAFMTNFDKQIKDIRRSGIVGAYMDINFTNRLSEEDWRNALNEFRSNLTDSVIETAIRRLPPEVYRIRGRELASTMKERRNIIYDEGMEYYRFIAKKVNVLGGNKDEVFKVSGNGDNLQVDVYTKSDAGETSLRYSRIFDPFVTKEIRLYGFNGDDYFNIDESAKSPIHLRIVGGKGNDTFDINGKIRNHLYDLFFEDNEIVSRSRTTKLFSNNPNVNEFQFRERIHNSFRFPRIAAGYNNIDGFMVGVGLSYKTYGFRKYPYASRQSISTLVAPTNKAYQVRYGGEFIDVFRHWDLVLNAEHFNPVLNTFFGLGNETIYDQSKDIDYYRTRYNYTSADIMVRKRFLNDTVMHFSIGPSIYNYSYNTKNNAGRILETPSVVGLDSADVYTSKLYAGGKVIFSIDNINDELVPMRGINWTTEFTALKALNNNAQPYTRILSTMDIYATLMQQRRLIAALHFGGGHIFSDNFEYFQALTLGGNNYLRGYVRNRFAGSSMAYASAELRLKLFDFNAYILKSDFGLVGFNDFGRVWIKNETSNKWHHGYGGGIYLIPYNTVMLSMIMGFSEEDRLFNMSLGTRINLIY
jgi:hypothetical protein